MEMADAACCGCCAEMKRLITTYSILKLCPVHPADIEILYHSTNENAQTHISAGSFSSPFLLSSFCTARWQLVRPLAFNLPCADASRRPGASFQQLGCARQPGKSFQCRTWLLSGSGSVSRFPSSLGTQPRCHLSVGRDF